LLRLLSQPVDIGVELGGELVEVFRCLLKVLDRLADFFIWSFSIVVN